MRGGGKGEVAEKDWDGMRKEKKRVKLRMEPGGGGAQE